MSRTSHSNDVGGADLDDLQLQPNRRDHLNHAGNVIQRHQ
jgi:hypothetical protein